MWHLLRAVFHIKSHFYIHEGAVFCWVFLYCERTFSLWPTWSFGSNISALQLSVSCCYLDFRSSWFKANVAFSNSFQRRFFKKKRYLMSLLWKVSLLICLIQNPNDKTELLNYSICARVEQVDQTTLTRSRKRSAAVFNQSTFKVHVNKMWLISGFPRHERWSWKLLIFACSRVRRWCLWINKPVK